MDMLFHLLVQSIGACDGTSIGTRCSVFIRLYVCVHLYVAQCLYSLVSFLHEVLEFLHLINQPTLQKVNILYFQQRCMWTGLLKRMCIV